MKTIDNGSKNDELLVVWKDPQTRNRFVIGKLWRQGGLYYFRYIRDEENERGSIESALQFNYTKIKMFSDINKTYSSEKLFTPFLKRLKGEDRKDMPFEVLKKTGGRLNTDTLEFMPPIDIREEKMNIKFSIAGWRYYDGDKTFAQLKVGQCLNLELEEDNLFDMHAIVIWTKNNQYKLGYVPAVYSRYIDKLVKEKKYEAKITELNSIEDPYSAVRVKFTGVMIKPDFIDAEYRKSLVEQF